MSLAPSVPVLGCASLSESEELQPLLLIGPGVYARSRDQKWAVLDGAVVGVPLTASMTILSINMYDILIVSSVKTLRKLSTWDWAKAMTGCPSVSLNAYVSSKYLLRSALLRPESCGRLSRSIVAVGSVVLYASRCGAPSPDSFPPSVPDSESTGFRP